MDRNTLHKLARKHMDANGLETWRITFSHSKATAGRCRYGLRVLEFSIPCAEVFPEDQTLDTILHEIAHALVGHSHGHDFVWRAKHRELGGNGEAQWNNKDARVAMAKYIGVCANGHEVTRNAKSEKMHRISCAKCSPVWDPRFKYTWYDGATYRATNGAVHAAKTVKFGLAANTSTTERPAPAAPAVRRTPPAESTVCTKCWTLKSSAGNCNC